MTPEHTACTTLSTFSRGESVANVNPNFVYYKRSTGGLPATKGFTLLELLIVLTILAVLLGIALSNYARYRANLELSHAQQLFVQELNRARSDARRLSQTQIVTWTTQTVKVGEREVRLSDSDAIRLVKITGASSLEYGAPYGTIRATDYEFELRGRSNLSKKVYVYGVTGKVKAAQ
jgi:prepilin-type N-terminal cleavage/methylation domain-containing protein